MFTNFVNKQIKSLNIKNKNFCSKDYEFLDENEHLGKNICLLTLGGSYSYGTNVEGSDIDIRGVATNSCSDILGLTNFEQVVDEKTDTTIYAFNKIINLLMNCNPNVLEMLGCLPEHYLYLNDIGRQLIDNRKLFISQKAIHSFGGYAITIVRDYDKLNGRNHKKDDAHLNKHSAHLLRLYYTCIDIFEKGDIITYRKDNHDILMKTRNGYFMNEDGSYKSEFFDILNDLKNRLEYAKSNTSIPKTPDFKKIQDFVIEVNRKVIQNNQ